MPNCFNISALIIAPVLQHRSSEKQFWSINTFIKWRYLLYELGIVLIFINLNSITHGCFGPSLLKIGPYCRKLKKFWIPSIYFRSFVIISVWKRMWPFFRTNLNPLHPTMLCAKLNWMLLMLHHIKFTFTKKILYVDL